MEGNNFRMLIQNCDLPPPLKVYHGLKGEVEETRMIEAEAGREDAEKLGLLKALQLSQTRAREAEKRRLCLANERDAVFDGLLRESLRASAYLNWLRVLELQVTVLKLRLSQQDGDDEEAKEDGGMVKDWMISLGLGVSLGIAGIGIALAWKYLF